METEELVQLVIDELVAAAEARMRKCYRRDHSGYDMDEVCDWVDEVSICFGMRINAVDYHEWFQDAKRDAIPKIHKRLKRGSKR